LIFISGDGERVVTRGTQVRKTAETIINSRTEIPAGVRVAGNPESQ
jgi:hypothetical protein